jgi:hypothetical protein
MPSSYLGIPLFMGNVKSNCWDRVSSLISVRVLSWNHKWLSFPGKIQLIKSFLNSIPIYLSILETLKSILNQLKATLHSFLSNENIGGHVKIPLIASNKVCLPKELGGTGIRDLDNKKISSWG